LDIEIIQERVREGSYLVRSHAVRHALKECFERAHMVDAVLQGAIIEEYPDDQRVLICGETLLRETVTTYLHVVCESSDPNYVDFVTAYVPDGGLWKTPPYERRKRKRN
jgi:hypothetical protein